MGGKFGPLLRTGQHVAAKGCTRGSVASRQSFLEGIATNLGVEFARRVGQEWPSALAEAPERVGRRASDRKMRSRNL